MTFRETLYLDHQSTTPVDEDVFRKMSPFFTALAGNPHSSDHAVGWESSRIVDSAVSNIAGLIGADPDEIVLTSGATESNNLALLGSANKRTNNNRRRILISAIEHKSVLAVGRVLEEKLGYVIEIIPVDREGRVIPSQLASMLADDVFLVSTMAVNNEIGTIQDVSAIAELVHDAGALFHCDAAQAPAAMNMSSLATYADLISLSAHKMYGPQGIGALFVGRDIQTSIEPLIYGGGQQNGLRSGTLPLPLCVGMGAAAAMFRTEDVEVKREQMRQLRDKFVEGLQLLPWRITENGPKRSRRHPGNANIRFEGFYAQDILQSLQPHLAASTGSACTTGIPEPSHVLKAIGLTNAESESSIRFSLGFSTTDADILRAVQLVGDALERLSETARSA